MSLTREQALEMFRSDDLIGVGMEADAIRRRLHPDGIVSYIIDRNINYTNICTEYCSFCAFYAPVKGPGREKGYLLDFDTIYAKIAETVEMGGTGVLTVSYTHLDVYKRQILSVASQQGHITSKPSSIELFCFLDIA